MNEITNRLDYYIENYDNLIELKETFCNRHVNEIIYSYDRIVKNVEYISNCLKNTGKSVLVIGNKTIQDYICIDLGIYDDYDVVYTDFDLRYEFPFDNDTFDFVICTEVLEHIKDRDGSERVDEFNFSGIDSFNKEINRVMKKEAILFLTTPNNCSFKNMIKLLQHRHVDRYFYHVREYTINDLTYMMSKYEFNIITLDCYDVFLDKEDSGDSVNFFKYNNILVDLISKINYIDSKYRGDTFYLTVKK